MSEPDIVTTLRRESFYRPTSRINSFGMPQMGFELTSFNFIAADEIERLRAERDEARREVCGLLVACHTDPDDDKPDPNLKHIHAGIRGWDCFKEDKEDTDD